MIVNYIEKKKIDHNLVDEYLSISEQVNIFTNNGPVKELLESKLHTLLGLDDTKKVICVNNGTSALHTIMLYYDRLFNKKMRWLSPSFTFPSVVVNNSNTILEDIDPRTGTLPKKHKTSLDDYDGIILTNLFGSVVDIPYWVDFCEKNNKRLIFDNASSPLSTYGGYNICSYGDMCFGSLHHTKYLGFGEGGFLVVPSLLYDTVSHITNFGYSSDRVHDKGSSNFKMSDISATFILQHITNFNLGKHLETQNKIISIVKNKGLKVFNYNENLVYGNLPLIIENRDLHFFRDLKIEVNKYYKPLDMSHENSINLYNKIINLPLHSGLTEFQINHINKVLEKV